MRARVGFRFYFSPPGFHDFMNLGWVSDFLGSGIKMSGFSPIGIEVLGNPIQLNIFLIIFAQSLKN